MKFTLILCLLALAACNTMEGAGKDLGSAGEGLSHSAKKVKESF